MKVDFLMEKIDETIMSVFELKFIEVIRNTLDIVEYVNKDISLKNENNKELWKQIIYYLTISLENKDYLAVGDILNYELKSILKEEILFGEE
ncbi:MAG TPA: hypothetical protein GXX37_07145 [Clostridiaceae bacterium]|nr:hypothetical protein [Clostridiaceae bacterium]